MISVHITLGRMRLVRCTEQHPARSSKPLVVLIFRMLKTQSTQCSESHTTGAEGLVSVIMISKYQTIGTSYWWGRGKESQIEALRCTTHLRIWPQPTI